MRTNLYILPIYNPFIWNIFHWNCAWSTIFTHVKWEIWRKIHSHFCWFNEKQIVNICFSFRAYSLLFNDKRETFAWFNASAGTHSSCSFFKWRGSEMNVALGTVCTNDNRGKNEGDLLLHIRMIQSLWTLLSITIHFISNGY